MDLLAKLERKLEGVVEGVFSRAFKTPLQPIEVAKRLAREMESHRTVSVNTTYVPNVYTVYLPPETFREFDAISTRLLAELEQYLRDYSGEHRYQVVGPITVRLAADAELKGQEMEIATANEAQAVPSVASAPSVMRSTPPNATRRTILNDANQDHTTVIPSATIMGLEVTGGEAQGSKIPLVDGLSIGRGPTNTLVLTESDVSRHHAEIVWQDGAWVLRDLGSTNGTFVNERRITAHKLYPGDCIKVGSTVILVR